MAKKKKDAPPAERKKRAPNSGSFSKDRPNPTAFQPGISPNPGGVATGYRALARALRADGAGRAEDRLCEALDLPRGSSRIQAQSRRIWRLMNYGEPSIALEASKFYAQLNGENAPSKLQFGIDPDANEDVDAGPPRLIVNFVSSRSDLAKQVAEGKILDRTITPQRERDPNAQAAQDEAERAAGVTTSTTSPPPSPSPTPKPWAALAAPRPIPESPQQTRQRVYKKLGY